MAERHRLAVDLSLLLRFLLSCYRVLRFYQYAKLGLVSWLKITWNHFRLLNRRFCWVLGHYGSWGLHHGRLVAPLALALPLPIRAFLVDFEELVPIQEV